MRNEFEAAGAAPQTDELPHAGELPMSAAEAVMINIFDWDMHTRYGGERMGWNELKTLDQTLQAHLKTLCPHVESGAVRSHYSDLLVHHWMGDLDTIRTTTAQVIDACLQAEHGDRRTLDSLTRVLARKLDYMEKNYPSVAEQTHLPIHVVADALEASEGGRRYHRAHEQVTGVHALRDMVASIPPEESKKRGINLFGILKPL